MADQAMASRSEPYLLAMLAAYTRVTLPNIHHNTLTPTRAITVANPVPKIIDEVSCLR